MWAYDVVQIRTRDGRAVRLLAVIDEYTKECLAIRPRRSIRSSDVIETLADLVIARGVPEQIRADNGPEFTARAVREWLGKVGAKALYIEPGSPLENGYVDELQRQAERRTLGPGGLLYAAGGAGIDRTVPPDLQQNQAPQTPGLQVAGAGNVPAREPCPSAGRTSVASGTNTEGRSR